MIVAAVPLKSLDRAKSRLASLLAPSDRSALALALAESVIAALGGAGCADRLGPLGFNLLEVVSALGELRAPFKRLGDGGFLS